MARDHGGNLADARARFGGEAAEWLDLSTGINPVAYPVGGLAPAVWAQYTPIGYARLGSKTVLLMGLIIG